MMTQTTIHIIQQHSYK